MGDARMGVGVGQVAKGRSLRQAAALGLAGLSLCGCATLQHQLDLQTSAVTGAEPLNDAIGPKPGHKPRSKSELEDSIVESYAKCELYKRNLVFGSRASNFGFDVLTTVFSALGTAFTPVGTVHAFTAAATISSGSKTALDADVYLNATAPLMAQALSTAYDTSMKDLHDRVAADKDPPKEDFGDVVYVHNKCSLTEAMVTLQTLETQAKPPAVSGASTVANGRVFSLADGREIEISSVLASSTGVTVGYTIKGAQPGAAAVAQPDMSLQAMLDLLSANQAKEKTP